MLLRRACRAFFAVVSLAAGVSCGGQAAVSAAGEQGAAAALASPAAATDEAEAAASASASGSSALPARAGASVPTTLDPLPTGTPSSLEVPQPGQVSPPGGSSQAPATNPLCPDDINSGASNCQAYITAFNRLRAAYCAYMATAHKDDEGDDIPFPGLDTLNHDAGVSNQCCKAGVTATGPC